MFNMAAYVEVRRLLDALGAIEARLMPNECEMLRSLKVKYAEPSSPEPFDVTSLEVMLRNVEIRKGYRFDPGKDTGRVIELPRTRGTGKR